VTYLIVVLDSTRALATDSIWAYTSGNTIQVTSPIAFGDSLRVAQYLLHNGDPDNYMSWTADGFSQVVGGETFVAITEDDAQDVLELGDDGDIDIKLSAGGDGALTVTGSTQNVSMASDLDVVDNITAGDMVIDEAAGVLDGSGASSFTISTSSGNVDITLDPAGTGDVIVASGNLGIGTATPGVNVDIRGNSATVRAVRFTGTAGSTPAIVLAKSDTAAIDVMNYLEDGDEIGSCFGAPARETAGTFGATGELVFFADGDHTSDTDLPTGLQLLLTPDGSGTRAAVVTVKQSGNVGISNTAPGNELEVSASNAGADIEISTWSTAAGQAGVFKMQKSASATINTLAQTAAGEDLGSLAAYGVNTSSASDKSAHILFEGDAAPDADAVPGRISFWTSDAVSSQQRMTIDDAGQVGIGTTTPDKKLDVTGDIALGDTTTGDTDATINFGDDGAYETLTWDDGDSEFILSDDLECGAVHSTTLEGGAINLTADANGVIVRDPSDQKFKTNIRDIDNALEKVLNLKGRQFDWADTRYGGRDDYGLVAQEVAEVAESLTGEAKYMSIKQAGIIALLVEAVKDQQAQIEELKAQMEAN